MSSIEVTRDRQLSMESDTGSKRRARSPLFQGESTNSHSRQESELSMFSFGSILYGWVSDPFGYKYDDVSELRSTANSSKPSFGHGIQTTLQSSTPRRVYAVTRRTSQLIQTVRHSISAAKSLFRLSLPPPSRVIQYAQA